MATKTILKFNDPLALMTTINELICCDFDFKYTAGYNDLTVYADRESIEDVLNADGLIIKEQTTLMVEFEK